MERVQEFLIQLSTLMTTLIVILSGIVTAYKSSATFRDWFDRWMNLPNLVLDTHRAMNRIDVTLISMIEADENIIIYTDAEGEVAIVSAGYTAITGLDTHAARKGGWKRAIHPDDLRDVEISWRHAVRNKEVYTGIFRFRHVDTSILGSIPVSCLASPMSKDDKLLGWVSRMQLEIEPDPPKPHRIHNPIAEARIEERKRASDEGTLTNK